MSSIDERLQNDYKSIHIWSYKITKGVSRLSDEKMLVAVGVNPKGELFFFDLDSNQFLHAIGKDEFMMKQTRTTNVGWSFYARASNKMNKKNIMNLINDKMILQEELVGKGAYRSGIKVNRILELKQKKHKILIIYTILNQGRERKKEITIYDAINNYEALVAFLQQFIDYSSSICSYCGSHMKKGYCENCNGQSQQIGDSNTGKKRIVSMIIFSLLAVGMFIAMMLLPVFEYQILVKVVLGILTMAFLMGVACDLGEILVEIKEKV